MTRKQRELPHALARGDTVAVVAPASRPDLDLLEAGVEALRENGLRVRLGRHLLDCYGHLAGEDRDRAADVMAAFLDREVRGVFCARGGSGSARIIPYLDLPAIAARPKVFVGYSDITALHLALARHAGWPTFYGPMVAAELGSCRDRECWRDLWQLVSRPQPVGTLPAPGARCLLPGVAEGALTGGTLCVVQAALATGYAVRTRGRILVLEDAQEPAWRVDRMLAQLSHAGLLQQAAGFVLGRLHDPAHADGSADDLDVERSVVDHLGPLGKPVLCDFPFGHIPSPLTLPLGCRARLDAGAGTLTVLEAAVSGGGEDGLHG